MPNRKGSSVVGLAVIAVVVGVLIQACGGQTDTPTTYDPAEQSALDALHGRCTETDNQLHAEAAKALSMMQERGINDETQVTVLQHLGGSIPANFPKTSCAQFLGAYITLRTGSPNLTLPLTTAPPAAQDSAPIASAPIPAPVAPPAAQAPANPIVPTTTDAAPNPPTTSAPITTTTPPGSVCLPEMGCGIYTTRTMPPTTTSHN